jgi:hypothetical protein
VSGDKLTDADIEAVVASVHKYDCVVIAGREPIEGIISVPVAENSNNRNKDELKRHLSKICF